MTANTEKDLAALRKIGEIVAQARDEMLKAVRPGITTAELDSIGARIFEKYGAKSAPKNYYRFPGFTCISLNDVAAHGIPGDRVVKEGDILNIDVSAELNGYFGDTGASVAVEPATELKRNICECSRAALYRAIDQAKTGARTNLIGKAIEGEARARGFNVIRNLTGHGVGHKLHEEPFNVTSFYRKNDRAVLKEGLVIAIEAFISSGAEMVHEDADGWALRTPDKSIVAQYEHTVVVTSEKAIILTAL